MRSCSRHDPHSTEPLSPIDRMCSCRCCASSLSPDAIAEVLLNTIMPNRNLVPHRQPNMLARLSASMAGNVRYTRLRRPR